MKTTLIVLLFVSAFVIAWRPDLQNIASPIAVLSLSLLAYMVQKSDGDILMPPIAYIVTALCLGIGIANIYEINFLTITVQAISWLTVLTYPEYERQFFN